MSVRRQSSMPHPQRLTLSRKAGFSLRKLSCQTNGLSAVVVARPSKWGNPFSLVEYGRQDALERYRRYIAEKVREGAFDPSELRGKNLACWCKPGLDCHADILLELATAPTDDGKR